MMSCSDFRDCTLCPRSCHADRSRGNSFCLGGYHSTEDQVLCARADFHMWEEPCISGERGSGAIFFTGCNLKCIFCQNAKIALGGEAAIGKALSLGDLEKEMLQLQERGANNINLVTPSHYLPQVKSVLANAKAQLHIPIVYNTSSYERVEALAELEPYVSVYLPDFKYMDPELAREFSHAPDYPDVAKAAISEMVRQCKARGGLQFYEGEHDRFSHIENGIITNGVIVRHLVLPGHVEDSKNIIRYLYETYKDDIYISIMNQYTPLIEPESDLGRRYPELTRRVTEQEYDEVVDFAIDLGVENGFIQEGETAQESFIPKWWGEEDEEAKLEENGKNQR